MCVCVCVCVWPSGAGQTPVSSNRSPVWTWRRRSLSETPLPPAASSSAAADWLVDGSGEKPRPMVRLNGGASDSVSRSLVASQEGPSSSSMSTGLGPPSFTARASPRFIEAAPGAGVKPEAEEAARPATPAAAPPAGGDESAGRRPLPLAP